MPKTKKKDLSPLLSSERIDWNSPPEIITLTVKLMRKIKLDPCSNPGSIVPAETKLSIEEGHNGLLAPWVDKTYCNPPYGDALPLWIHKGSTEHQRSLDMFEHEYLFLVPARTDTQWFSHAKKTAQALGFWKGRLTFLGAPHPAPFPSLLIYYGPNPYLFASLIEDRALVWI